jgi:hypothetical protein
VKNRYFSLFEINKSIGCFLLKKKKKKRGNSQRNLTMGITVVCFSQLSAFPSV